MEQALGGPAEVGPSVEAALLRAPSIYGIYLNCAKYFYYVLP